MNSVLFTAICTIVQFSGMFCHPQGRPASQPNPPPWPLMPMRPSGGPFYSEPGDPSPISPGDLLAIIINQVFKNFPSNGLLDSSRGPPSPSPGSSPSSSSSSSSSPRTSDGSTDSAVSSSTASSSDNGNGQAPVPSK